MLEQGYHIAEVESSCLWLDCVHNTFVIVLDNCQIFSSFLIQEKSIVNFAGISGGTANLKSHGHVHVSWVLPFSTVYESVNCCF